MIEYQKAGISLMLSAPCKSEWTESKYETKSNMSSKLVFKIGWDKNLWEHPWMSSIFATLDHKNCLYTYF